MDENQTLAVYRLQNTEISNQCKAIAIIQNQCEYRLSSKAYHSRGPLPMLFAVPNSINKKKTVTYYTVYPYVKGHPLPLPTFSFQTLNTPNPSESVPPPSELKFNR
jgi:hypothetical protein